MIKCRTQDYLTNKEKLLKEIKTKCNIINDVLAKTEYVLLCKDDNLVKLGAYIDRKTEEFFFPACKEWTNHIKMVCQYKICVYEKDHFTPVREENLMEESDFCDYYVLISRKDAKNEFFLDLYHKNENIFSIKTVDSWFKCGIDLKIIYTTQKDNIFTYWIYKNMEHIPLLDSYSRWFSKSGYFEKNKKFPNIIQGNFVEMIFHYINCKIFYVAEYFAKTKGDYFSLLPKQFEDDDTCNYIVKFRKDKYEDIAFMNYCLESEIGGYAVYGFPVKEIEKGCLRTKSENSLYIEFDMIYESIKYEIQCRDVLKHIYKVLDMKENLFCLPDLPYFEKTAAQSASVLMYLQQNDKNIKRDDYSIYKKKYNLIYDKLVKSGIVQVKWKSEYELYKLVKRKYKDAIYQYRDKWIGMQSLDIYIPSLKVGIEYQGKQHYMPISLFGGEEEFEHRKILDENKKRICEENGVSLIEWKYDEKISSVLLEKKIKWEIYCKSERFSI